MMKKWSQLDTLFAFSFLLALTLFFWIGFKEKESHEIIQLIMSLSVTMAGFGLLAFQIAHVSNTTRNDFIETSMLMVLSTLTGLIYLVRPEAFLIGFNFGEVSLFCFTWSMLLALVILVEKRFDFLK